MSRGRKGATEPHRFRATLRPSGRGAGGHLVEVPPAVVDSLGGRGRTPVAATFNGVPYRGSIVSMGGSFVLGVTRAIMSEAGVGAGDVLDVTVELDTDERTVAVPPDLQAALDANASAKRAWDRLSFTHRKEHAKAIEEAKRPETRARRVARTIEQLGSDPPS